MSDPTQRFEIRYSPWWRWFLVALWLGPRRSFVEIDPTEVRVRMGWGFRASAPRSSIVNARRHRDVWWGIGAHTDLRGRWLVNGSVMGIVAMDLDPRALGRSSGIPIRPKAILVSLVDPDGFLRALGAPHQTED